MRRRRRRQSTVHTFFGLRNKFAKNIKKVSNIQSALKNDQNEVKIDLKKEKQKNRRKETTVRTSRSPDAVSTARLEADAAAAGRQMAP